MPSFLDRLVSATQWGAALALAAGCGGASDSSSERQVFIADASTDGAGGSDANDDAGLLPETPYPEVAPCELGSSPEPSPFGSYGSCCRMVGCMDPVEGACLAPDEIRYWNLPGFPAGSGSCLCEGVKGPYANRKPDEGACCYAFGAIGCDGRPLVVDAVMRLAPLVARADWGARRARGHG